LTEASFNLRLDLVFPLDEYLSSSVVNLTFLYCRPRDTQRMVSAMTKAAGPSIVCAVMLLAVALFAEAQQPTKVPRMGYLSRDLHPSDSRAATPVNLEAFRQGLRELGYVEGKNIVIEYRFAEGRFERLPVLAEELVRLKVDIIVADVFTSARAASKVTTTIPIVVTGGTDPVGTGLVASLARPGGNITGLTGYTVELLGKRLELMKEAVPKVSRMGFLNDVESTGSKAMFDNAQGAAKSFGVKFQLVEVKAQDPDIDGAFRLMVKDRIGAVIISPSPRLSLSLHRKKILRLVEQNRMPAMYGTVGWIEDGGLMYYGANTVDLARRGATYVDKILKGAKPADLPFERPVKFDLGINLKAAQQIGLAIPPNVLARADKVIK
jgi:putative tryptophan/tyrosine transport system substrate-binding protein